MTTLHYPLKLILAFTLLLLHACNSENSGSQPENEIYMWSHNDYEQPQPLQDAVGLGFQMIESDVHLVDGKLYVTHDHPETPDQTPLLEDQYLEPLAEIIEQNNGVVIKESSVPFYLVIDVKTEAEPTFEAISEVIEPYSELFTRKENGTWIEGPLNLLISGNRPVLGEDDAHRIAFIDGRVPMLGEGHSPELYPLISDNWNNYFTWDGIGEMPDEEFEELEAIVKRTHDEDKMIRFWATPDRPAVWRTLLAAGVDVINVDDLMGFKDFLDEEGFIK